MKCCGEKFDGQAANLCNAPNCMGVLRKSDLVCGSRVLQSSAQDCSETHGREMAARPSLGCDVGGLKAEERQPR